MRIRKLVILFFVFICGSAYTQQPCLDTQRFIRNYLKVIHQINVVTLSSPDMYVIEEKDRMRDELFKVRTSAVILPLKDSFFDKSTVVSTVYGNLYLLKITSFGALALNMLSDNFFIAQGDVLMICSTLDTTSYVSYTEHDNTTDGMFMSDYVYGDTLIVAYMQTKQSTKTPKLDLQGIGYFYRDVSFENSSLKAGFGSSGSCNVNAACSEGKKFQNQKNSVVRMMIPVNSLEIAWCTGTLVNNTNYDRKPYILSAAHCIEEMTSTKYLSQTVFTFNYESSGCSKPKQEPSKTQSRTGATLLTYDKTFGTKESDYMLLLLNQTIPDSYGAYWSGWNRTEDLVSGAVCLHHPSGDIKKISTVDGALQDIGYDENLWDYYTHCMVRWKKTQNGYGVTEGGSSGASLFDAQGRVLGVLSGGVSDCSESAYNRVDWFGRLCYFFDKVKEWLDPQNTGLTEINGDPVQNENDTDFEIYPVPTSDILNVKTLQLSDNADITIVNVNGVRVYSSSLEQDEEILQIDVASWDKGVYFITLNTNSGAVTKSFIVK